MSCTSCFSKGSLLKCEQQTDRLPGPLSFQGHGSISVPRPMSPTRSADMIAVPSFKHTSGLSPAQERHGVLLDESRGSITSEAGTGAILSGSIDAG